MVTKEGKPAFVFGVMGGDMQAQGHVEVLVNMIDFGMNVQEAGEAPRVEHIGSPTPTGRPGDDKGGTINAERGIPGEVIAELIRRGHQVSGVPSNNGGYQGIWIDPRTGMLHGGSEYRKDGCLRRDTKAIKRDQLRALQRAVLIDAVEELVHGEGACAG